MKVLHLNRKFNIYNFLFNELVGYVCADSYDEAMKLIEKDDFLCVLSYAGKTIKKKGIYKI